MIHVRIVIDTVSLDQLISLQCYNIAIFNLSSTHQNLPLSS